MKSKEGLHTAYLDNYVTVFAPSNDAIDMFEGVTDENFILNHMGKLELYIIMSEDFVILAHVSSFCLSKTRASNN